MRLSLYEQKVGASLPDQPALLDLDTVGAPYKANAQAFAAAGNEAGAWANQFSEMQKREQAAAAEVEAIKLQTEFERDLVNKDIKLRSDKDYDYLTHDQRLDEAGQELTEIHAGLAKSPVAAAKFRVAAMRTLKEKVIATKYEAKARLDGEADAANYDQNQRVAVSAANGPEELREAKIREQERFNVQAANEGRIKPEEAAKRTRELRENVDTILARRSMQADPDQFLLDLEDLEQYESLSAPRRQQLWEQAVKMSEKKDKHQDRINKEYSGALKKHLIDRMDSGVDAVPEIRALRDALTDEDYEHLIARNDKIHKESPKESDFETYTRLEVGIRRREITDYKTVDDAKSKLTTAHYTHFMGLIDGIREEGRKEKKSDTERTRDRLTQAGRDYLTRAFKTVGVMDFDQVATHTEGLALAEFGARVAREKDKDPGIIANEIVKQYAVAITDKVLADQSGVGRILRYKTPQEIDAAYARKEFTQDQYLAQRRILDRYLYLREIVGGAPPKPDAAAPKPQQSSSSTQPAARKPFPGSLATKP